MPTPYQTPTPYINPAILTSAATGILPGLLEHNSDKTVNIGTTAS